MKSTTVEAPTRVVDPVIGRLAMLGFVYDVDFTAYYTGKWKLSGITVLNPKILEVLEAGVQTSVGRVVLKANPRLEITI